MASIAMHAKEIDVKTTLGFTDQEWRRLQVDARYEYDFHDEIFNPNKTWNELNIAKKKESITRLKAKYGNTKGAAAEWMLHRRHVAARETSKNHQKTQASTITGPPKNKSDPPASTSKMNDPVKDAAGSAE
ncbi:hypothetical protein MMC11_005883 [Xylographa trunciseda]|nr:hypothetical protein [Xylographa trunciseda]